MHMKYKSNENGNLIEDHKILSLRIHNYDHNHKKRKDFPFLMTMLAMT